MSFSEKRKYERRPYVKPIRFYLIAPYTDLYTDQSDKNYSKGLSVDISEEGLGMITEDPLKEGDILIFKDEVRVDNITATSGIVKWVQKLADTRYRIGLEFSVDHLHSGGIE